MRKIDFITPTEFERAYNKVKKGKKNLANKGFLKFKTTDLNSLGKFYKEDVRAENYEEIKRDFYNESYKIRPFTCVVLPKGNGGYRTILMPHPRDRVVFSILLVLFKRQRFQQSMSLLPLRHKRHRRQTSQRTYART